MDQHLTVREACKFSGKSESTIKRLIREITRAVDHEDRNRLLPSPEEVENRRSTGDTFVWKINQDLLIKRFPKGAMSEKSVGVGDKGRTTRIDSGESAVIVGVLRDQLQSKDRQILTLETQLDRKDEQIKSLNDRMHESNVLMRELQNRLSISAPEAENPAEPKTSTVVPSANRSRGVKNKQKKSRSVFGMLFGLR
jgi:ABC-type phosphate transport system auxiliary subunit